MMTAATARVLLGLALGLGLLALHNHVAARMPCDVPFWQGYRAALGVSGCR